MTDENLPRRRFLRGEFLRTLQSERTALQGFQGVRPPWAKANQTFIDACTRCGDCVAACETHILIQGEGGFPEIDFQRGECTFCEKCVSACSASVFRPTNEMPWQHKADIGENCLTRQNVACRSCQDCCESRAIRFTLALGRVAAPTIDESACNGCGACIRSCPVAAIKLSYPEE
ncbi:ferredoxin-type protein NapF [Caviibacterium pharyngocola]|uniref:Ferredoxin-type protein NapF n=1 Tax=Caviibacterium pharyngocola TaxID=28159 RepID=A0A2M8RXF1_9PAST|nr:ferredoxin-type protein NapF [Caviibacterium pharyngocola]PJG83569.1 ferredoxin-type protein NapF [Caviibacterium pharyngocola]